MSSAAPRRDPRTGTWGFVIDLPPWPDGRRRQIRRRGLPTRKAAQEALEEVRVDARKGAYVPPRRQTLTAFLQDDWLPAKRARLEPSTFESYERHLRLHVIPTLGGIQLQALDPAHLNRLYGHLLEHGRRDGMGGLSARTVRYVGTILGAALDDAVRWGRIVTNPARRADPPSASAAKPPEMRTWDRQTLGRFLELTRSDRYGPAFLFLATTGCRRGEALGLRWADVDLEARVASLRQTVTAVAHRKVVAPRTKTGKGRQIRLDPETVAALRAWRARQLEERLAVGAGWQEGDFVFTLPDGRPYHPERFSREFDRRVDRYGLPRIRLHDLRHTWATLALAAGVDVKVVSERLGHTSPTVTWSTYQHVTPAMATDAAERVADLIFRP